MDHTIEIVGRLGRDPEMRYTPSGTAVTNISVAADNSYTNSDGEKVTETAWFRVAAWNKLAEIVNQYLKKGDPVIVRGQLKPDENGNPRIWTRQDGTPAASYEVTAHRVIFLPKAKTELYNDDYQDEGAPVAELPAAATAPQAPPF